MSEQFDWLNDKPCDELLEIAKAELAAIGFLLWNGKWPSDTNELNLTTHRATIMACRERYRRQAPLIPNATTTAVMQESDDQ